MQVAQFIIGNLDDDGYLRRELTSIVDDLAFSQNINCTDEEALDILKEIQQLDPAGVGARNLQECLLLQLKAKKPSMNVVMGYKILNEYFDEFTKKHYEKIITKLELTEEEMRGALGEILKLNPKPGGSSAEASKGATAVEITPDFILYNHDGELELQLNSANSYDLRVSKQYVEMLQEYGKEKSKTAREAVTFVKQKIDAAKWFIDALRQRQETLLMVMRSILAYQYDYFTSGDETKIKPMILKDIADRTNLDISTISRVVNSKYIQTEYGIILLKFFFSESLSTDSGEEVSTREVKKILDDCISNENKRKPLTDDELALVLKEKGYNIARRTVAKYREQLNIPVARLRKEL
jgi:RNA polymerase sigma-54 factor